MKLKTDVLAVPAPSRAVTSTNIPVGLPATRTHKGREYRFDCLAGNGDPVYQYVKDSGERFHIIVVNDTGEGMHNVNRRS